MAVGWSFTGNGRGVECVGAEEALKLGIEYERICIDLDCHHTHSSRFLIHGF